eukprot:scaffold1794_cov107-Cylindrotheca_fusiformis.AAC.4
MDHAAFQQWGSVLRTTEADLLKVALNAHFGDTIGVVSGQDNWLDQIVALLFRVVCEDGALFKAIDDSGELRELTAYYYFGIRDLTYFTTFKVPPSAARVHLRMIGSNVLGRIFYDAVY